METELALARLMTVLTLNAGSSSLKFSVFAGDKVVLRGEYEAITTAAHGHVRLIDGTETALPTVDGIGHEAVLPSLFAWVDAHLGTERITAVGHRIVHGGARFTESVVVTDENLAAIDALSPLAPLHQPHNVAAIKAARRAEPGIPQVACFDTAFHRTLPAVARLLPLPARLDLRRYGFHGLSFEWIARQLSPRLAAGRTIVAHLGSGASLCALQGGVSIETTMGMTPLDGLVMATRCGSLDPGVVLYLLQAEGMPAKDVEHLLYHDAGLLGIAGLSDMRKLHDSDDPAAAAAIDLFTYRIAQHCGAMAAALGGIDGIVFTGGIGEHDAQVRASVCARLRWLGLDLDPRATAPGLVSTPASAAEIWVIPSDEEAVIAGHAQRLLAGAP